jgi:hypothetical protein
MVTPHGWGLAAVLLVAAGIGAAGGVLAELLQTRGSITGTLELPSQVPGPPRLLELGLFSSVILGAGAGVAILYFLPPTVTTAGETSYDVVKGVALALLAGSFGRTVLSALQARLLASLNAQQARTTAQVASAQLDQQAKAVQADTEAAVRLAVGGGVDPANVDQVVNNASQTVAQRALDRASDAKSLIAAVAPATTAASEE